MKGIVLAGGTGSRLHPLTRVTNKHLLPIYNKPMIYYPLQTLVDGGIEDILIVTGGSSAGDFLRLLRNGKDFGLHQLNFAYQEGEGGIADALRLAEYFAGGEKVCVILGDNIIEGNVRAAAQKFEKQERGAKILLKEVPDPERFGVPVLENGRIVRIEDKPSGRQEYEITDVNNSYLAENQLTHEILDGWWTDAGTFESLWRASNLVREQSHRAAEHLHASHGGS